MWTRRDLLTAALATAGVGVLPFAAGCGREESSMGQGNGGGTSTVARSTRERSAGDPKLISDVVTAMQQFATDLYGAVATAPGNTVCSPYSLVLALAMTRNGAKGSTAAEMDRVLHAPELPALNGGLNALTQHVEGLAHERTRDDGTDASLVLGVANSLWGQQGFRWEQDFLDSLAGDFGAGLRIVDYPGDVEAARGAINAWTSERTNERIPELVPDGVLDKDTRLVLVNAIYLKAPWAAPFAKHATSDAPFNCADGKTVTVPMMSSDFQGAVGYATGDGWQAVDLMYDGGGLAMAVVVPDAGRFGEVEQAIDGARLQPLLGGFQPTTVQLRLPKWTFRTRVSLAEVLATLGMPTAFTDGADFSGMTTQDQLAIDAVLHEAFIAVDEAGTEAAAATAVVMQRTSAMLSSVDLTVDRPFLFVIHDVESGAPLFLGRVTDPTTT
jgi:serpin B